VLLSGALGESAHSGATVAPREAKTRSLPAGHAPALGAEAALLFGLARHELVGRVE
jgi:hypothetical protein